MVCGFIIVFSKCCVDCYETIAANMMKSTRRITIDTEVKFNDPLPEAVDVVIIGGGVIGVFTALNLVEAGKKVLLCEKGRIAGEQSSRNWGWIRQQRRDEDEVPIAMQSVQLWKDIDQTLQGRCGVKTTGVAYLTSNTSALADLEKWVEIAKRHGLHSEMLTPDQINAGFSGQSNKQWVGGVRTPSDGKGEPWQAVPAVADYVHSFGASIIENCAVRRLDIQAGQITGVVTEHGTVACQQVLLAAGAWSRLFLGAHDVKIPQLSVLSTAAQTVPLPDFSKTNCADEGLGLRRRDDGGYTIALTDQHNFHLSRDAFTSLKPWLPAARHSWKQTAFKVAAPKGFPDAWSTPRHWSADDVTPFENMRVLEPKVETNLVERMRKRFTQRFPAFEQPEIAEAWSGMIDAMPDMVPIVDSVPQIPGLMLATGMSGHGFGIGPGYGRIIARRMMSLPDEHDLSRFRFNRFTDGSVLKSGPSI